MFNNKSTSVFGEKICVKQDSALYLNYTVYFVVAETVCDIV